jgi:N-acetylglutamate synthase-like GNAT family acetyltransferase
MDIQIRRAQPDEAAVLTEIAHAAKRHWGYPENWIAHWKDELTITPDFIANNEVYVAGTREEIAGCCALVMSDSLAELEHMWILPEHMGSGVGRALSNQIVERATTLKAKSVELSADPNAEGFYERMGAKRIGDVRSEIEGQPRVLPRMSVDLESLSPIGTGVRGEGA